MLGITLTLIIFRVRSIFYLERSQRALETLHSFIHRSDSSMNSSCLSAHRNTAHKSMGVANSQWSQKLGEQNIIIAPGIGLDITVNTLFLGKVSWDSYHRTFFKFLSRRFIQNTPGEIFSSRSSACVPGEKGREALLHESSHDVAPVKASSTACFMVLLGGVFKLQ